MLTLTSRLVPIVVSVGAPVILSNTNGQGTSNGDMVDDGAEEVPSDEEGELENGNLEEEEEDDDDNFKQDNY
jgi:hypothetical protein